MTCTHSGGASFGAGPKRRTGTASFGVGRATRRYRSTESSERDLVVVFGKSALAEKVPFDKAKREEMPEKFLPYSRHVNEHVVALDNGDLMLMLELDGRPFETSDVRDLNDWHKIGRASGRERVCQYV